MFASEFSKAGSELDSWVESEAESDAESGTNSEAEEAELELAVVAVSSVGSS